MPSSLRILETEKKNRPSPVKPFNQPTHHPTDSDDVFSVADKRAHRSHQKEPKRQPNYRLRSGHI